MQRDEREGLKIRVEWELCPAEVSQKPRTEQRKRHKEYPGFDGKPHAIICNINYIYVIVLIMTTHIVAVFSRLLKAVSS